jgi:hypothetical protein
VSGFLARVAARAVGQPAAARPRLPGLYEQPAGSGLEVVDTEATAPRPTQAAAAPFEGSRTAGPTELAPPARPTAAPATRPGPARERAEPRTPASNTLLQTRSGAARIDPAGDERAEPASPPQQPGELLELEAAVAAVAAEPRVATARPLPAAEPPRAAAPRTAAREEQPAVRVHIGRLEVRATLPEPAPQAARREAPRPPDLSLSDYLRGKRAAS